MQATYLVTPIQIFWLITSVAILVLVLFALGLIIGYAMGRNSAGQPFVAVPKEKPFDPGETDLSELDEYAEALGEVEAKE